MATDTCVVEVNDLVKFYTRRRGFLKRAVATVKAVDQVSFRIHQGETLGLVGESGSGKTTTGRCVLHAINPSGGEILLNLTGNGEAVNAADLEPRELKEVRRHMAMVFQDPYSSLNPRMPIREIVGEPLIIHRATRNNGELEDKVTELLAMVGLDPNYMRRYPHAFSGGQRQRIAIARALALRPSFVVADEPVSALDVSIQVQILNLLKDLQEKFSLAYLFIAHNLTAVKYVSDRIAVMYAGKIVELADTRELFLNPQHPYTESLLSALPKPHPRYQKKTRITGGEVPDPANLPSGCCFHPRCRYAQEVCLSKEPQLTAVSSTSGRSHAVSCHFAEQLDLAGV